MSNEESVQQPSLLDALAPFRNQSHVVHVIAVGLGISVWIGTYYGVMLLTGWETFTALDTPTAVATRQIAASVASLICGGYFGLLWFRGIGGPFLNFLYPIAILALLPDQVFFLFQEPTSHTITTAEYRGYRFNGLKWYFDHLIQGVPPTVGVIAGIKFWEHQFLSEAERQEFVNTSLPEIWNNK